MILSYISGITTAVTIYAFAQHYYGWGVLGALSSAALLGIGWLFKDGVHKI